MCGNGGSDRGYQDLLSAESTASAVYSKGAIIQFYCTIDNTDYAAVKSEQVNRKSPPLLQIFTCASDVYLAKQAFLRVVCLPWDICERKV